jgi:hypothetical protein
VSRDDIYRFFPTCTVRVSSGLRLRDAMESFPNFPSIRSMQSTRPAHHANASRSLFQNPWTLTDSTPSTSTYWRAFLATLNPSTFLTIPNISLERARNFESYPHIPVKVVKPGWGHSTFTAASPDPILKATWLGHAVCRGSPLVVPYLLILVLFVFPRVSSSSFRVLL